MNRSKRILVIDDEPGFTRLLKLSLEESGTYQVREENDPRQARAAAQEFRPDLVLVDVIMPELDGGDVVAQIHGDSTLKHVPVVFLTATVLKEEVAARGGAIGGFPFLAKPVTAKALMDTIERTLHEHTGGAVKAAAG